MYFGTLPYGYYWLRNTSGNVLGRVKAVGKDEKGIVHTAYCPVTISGVANNTTSGTLTHNETWGGQNILTGNVIVPSNITLKILPVTTVKFPSNVSLTINGKLNAQGTTIPNITFTSTGGTSPGSWGSIVLSGSGASGSILNYVNMQYGTEIDVTNTSNITIQNSTIQNCTNGIVGSTATGCSVLNNTIKNVTNHGINLNNSTFSCKDNIIYKTPGFAYYHTGFGILYGGGSSGTIYQNDICGVNQGIGAIWGSSITSNGPFDHIRNNRVTNCFYGILVYASSNAVFGPNPYTGGMWNSVYGSTYYNASVGVTNTNYPSSLYAYGDWWGSNPPNTSLFQVGSGSSLTYFTGSLTSDPWSGFPLHTTSVGDTGIIRSPGAISSVQEVSEQAISKQESLQPDLSSVQNPIVPLLDGINLCNQGKYGDAKDFFLSYLSKHPDNQAAYVELYNCYSEETASDIINYFTSLPPQALQGHKLLLSNLYLKQGNIEMAKKVNNDVINANPNTLLSARGKLNNALIALNNGNDFNGAVATFSDVLKRPDLSTDIDLSLTQERIETYAVTHGMQRPKFNNQAGSNQTTPTSITVQNYPNPFNPTTMISYQLPNDAKVTLKVFDILGREVVSLVDGEVVAGNHTATFDGSSLSSGIYFTRMIVQPQEGMTIVQVKKMLLMK